MTNKYKIVFIPKLGDAQFEGLFNTRAEAELALEAIANYTLFLHESGLMPDYANCGMVFEFDGDDWIEIDGDGNEL